MNESYNGLVENAYEVNYRSQIPILFRVTESSGVWLNCDVEASVFDRCLWQQSQEIIYYDHVFHAKMTKSQTTADRDLNDNLN